MADYKVDRLPYGMKWGLYKKCESSALAKLFPALSRAGSIDWELAAEFDDEGHAKDAMEDLKSE